MVYVHYIHPNLSGDATYQAYLASATHRNGDWIVLFNWLGKHAYQGWPEETIGDYKCWYSEFSIGGSGDKEVEHFRPKGSFAELSEKQKELLQKRGVDISRLHQIGDGYPWLKFNPDNFRLASASVNGSANKGARFPVLSPTARLATGSTAFDTECAVLLDPSRWEDTQLLAVDPMGNMVSLVASPAGDSETLECGTERFKWLRTEVSIVVYDLQHPDWVRGRLSKYKSTTYGIAQLADSIRNKDSGLAKVLTTMILKSAACFSIYALASRSAIRAYLTANEGSTDPILTATCRVLQGILDEIARRENHPVG